MADSSRIQNALFEPMQPAHASQAVHKLASPLHAVEDSLASGLSLPSTYKPSMPDLAPPSAPAASTPPSFTATILMVIETLNGIHQVGGTIQLTQNRGVVFLGKQLEELQLKDIEKMKEIAERTQTSDTWGTLQTIGSYILSALNFILGGLLISSGNVAVGGVLIASGLISVANLAFSSTGLWAWAAKQIANDNKEYAKQLEEVMPIAVGLTAAALSFMAMGDAWALQEGFEWAQVLLVAKVAADLAEGVTTAGKGVSDYRVTISKSEHAIFSGEMFTHEQELSKGLEYMQEVVKSIGNSVTPTAHILKLITYANHKTLSI